MTTVADVLVDGLVRAGTARVFVVDGDRDAESLGDSIALRLPVLRVSGADVACVMAAVSGALSGAPGAAVIGRELDGTAGGLAYASVERAPVIVINSGASVAALIAEGAMKAVLTVTPESAAHRIAHGCQLAMKEPWGPVRLDVLPAMVTVPALPVATSCRPAPLAAPDAATLDAAVRLLEASERPLIVVGRLCRSAAEAAWVRPFAEARPAPVLATAAGRGVVPDPHPLVIGSLDAGQAERTLLADADLVVAVGLDPVEVRQASWSKPLLELTPVAPESPPHDRVVVVGDIGSILEELAPRLRDRRLAEWNVARLHALKQAASAPPAAPRPLGAFRVVEAARRLTPAGTLGVFEHGDAWREAARAWQALAPHECLISSEPATEGFAVVAAAAALLASPGRRVVCFTEARAIRRAPQHLATVAALGVPVPIVVADGGASPPALPVSLRRFTAPSIAEFAGLFDSALAAGTPAVLAVAGL